MTKPSKIFGRDTELEQFLEIYKRMKNGQGTVVLVRGDIGRGKSHFCNAVFDRLREHERTGTGTGPQLKIRRTRCPSSPCTEVYPDFLRAIWDEAETEPLDTQQAAQCSAHDRSRSWSAARLPETDWTRQRKQAHMIESALNRMKIEAQKAVVIYFIDDLHCADPNVLVLLEAIMYQVTLLHRPIMIVTALRNEALQAHASSEQRRHELRRLVHMVASAKHGHTIEMPRLSMAATQKMIEQLFGKEKVTAKFVNWMSKWCNGNPFFIHDLSDYIKSRRVDIETFDWDDPEATKKLHVPSTIAESIDSRVDGLTKQQREIVSCAAVLGDEFDIEVIAEVVRREPERVLGTVQELIRIGMITAQHEGRFRFTQPLVREQVYESLSATRKQLLNRMIGQAKIKHGLMNAAELARHFYHGDMPEKALEWAQKAAKNAQQRGATFLAIQYNKWALESMEVVDHDRSQQHQYRSILRSLGQLYSKSGNWQKAIEKMKRVLQYEREADATEMIMETQRQIGQLYLKASDWDHALDYFNDNLAKARKRRMVDWKARAMTDIGEVYYRRGHYREACEQFRRANKYVTEFVAVREHGPKDVETTGPLQSEIMQADIATRIGATQYRLGNIPQAIDQYMDALELYHTIDDQYGLGRVKHRIGMIYQKTQQFERASQFYTEASAIFDDRQQPHERARVHVNQGEIAYYRGDWDRALEHWKESERMDRKIQNKYGLAMVYGLMGSLYANRGAFKKAKQYFNRDFELSTQIENRLGIAHVYRHLGELYFLRRKTALAVNNLKRSLEIFNTTGNRYEKYHVEAWLGRVYIQKDMQAAERYLEHARAGLEVIEEPLKTAQVKLFRGCWYAEQAEYAPAMDLFEESRQILRMLKRPFEAAKLDIERGKLHLALGEKDSADAILQNARQVFEQLHAKPYLERVDKALGMVIF